MVVTKKWKIFLHTSKLLSSEYRDRMPGRLGGLLHHIVESARSPKKFKKQYPDANGAVPKGDGTNYFYKLKNGCC
jgi:hypothetical protein